MNQLIKNITVVNEGKQFVSDMLIKDGRIERIDPEISIDYNISEINGEGKILFPGVIDDQVHFRQPGLTHKADIASESAAAAAGGVTTFMEMPNTKPSTLTKELLEEKYAIADQVSPVNYSFFMGASNDNYDEVMRTDIENVCGIKIFMGSSTGNMLVDNQAILEKIFANAPCLIATHCEDEPRIRERTAAFKEKYGEEATAVLHPEIRDVEACYLSSSRAIDLAKQHNTRLHILHISTAKETDLFRNDIPLTEKRITSEVCVHHLSLNDQLYPSLGNNIKCNPAIKSASDQETLWKALLDDRLDIIATDHAPHTTEEKSKHYFEAPSGLPLIQHTLYLMLQHHSEGRISLERIVEKMCHAPAQCFNIRKRGYLREGYFADAVILEKGAKFQIKKENILHKCNWSPFEGKVFDWQINRTLVNGNIAYSFDNHKVSGKFGMRLQFDR